MEYEKKYKESLAMARDYYKANLKLNKADENLILEDIFPELKESEDEREELINYLKGIRFVTVESAEKVRNWIVWLEKQGDNLVKNGYTNNKDYIKYADKYSYEIWRKLMDNFKNIKDYHIGCNDVSEIVLNAIIDTFNWIEKGGDKNKVSQHVEAVNEEKVDTANKVEPKDYSSIDPHFGKPIDNVEPKFKVGDFIVNDYCSGKVIKITDDAYLLDTGQGIPFSCEHNAHLWNVTKDAKDGDVLAISWWKDNNFWEKIIIFKKYHNKGVEGLYCMPCVEGYGNTFKNGKLAFNEKVPYYSKTWTCNLHPATKEQRDALEKAMADAGYAFDFVSKELKKLSQSEVTKMSDQEEIAEIPFGAKDSELQEATYYISKGFHAEIDDDKVVIKKGEKPTAWSGEDERNMQNIDSVLFYDKTLPQDTYVKLRNFLKSLKQRIGG